MNEEETTRFGVSLPEALLEEFDKLIQQKNYASRSEAIRDLIRDELVDSRWESGDQQCVGTISLVYNHHTRELVSRLMDIQHEYTDEIISNTHVHLDQDNCLEILAVAGKAARLRKIGDRLQSTRGVIHAKLTTSATGEKLE